MRQIATTHGMVLSHVAFAVELRIGSFLPHVFSISRCSALKEMGGNGQQPMLPRHHSYDACATSAECAFTCAMHLVLSQGIVSARTFSVSKDAGSAGGCISQVKCWDRIRTPRCKDTVGILKLDCMFLNCSISMHVSMGFTLTVTNLLANGVVACCSARQPDSGHIWVCNLTYLFNEKGTKKSAGKEWA